MATARTVARHPGEGNIHTNSQAFATALVHDDGSVEVHPSVVEELNGREGENYGRREDGHCNRTFSTRFSCTVWSVAKYSQNAPVLVLTLTSSMVYAILELTVLQSAQRIFCSADIPYQRHQRLSGLQTVLSPCRQTLVSTVNEQKNVRMGQRAKEVEVQCNEANVYVSAFGCGCLSP